MKNEDKNKLDYKQINETIKLSKHILHVIQIFVTLAALYVGVLLLKHFNIFPIIFNILRIMSPLFIGMFIAWLFNPIVKALRKKGIRRGLGTGIIYVVFLGLLILIISLIIPILTDQTTNLVNMIPNIVSDLKEWITSIIDRLGTTEGLDAAAIKTDIFSSIEEIAKDLTTSLPDTFVSLIQPFLSGMWSFAIGLIIGFYLLMGFDNVEETLLTWFPKKIREDAHRLFNELNLTLRKFIKGAMIDAFVVFVVTSIGFAIVGLESPILFGLFCGITNVIPYAGPYIGGAPAVLVAFSGGPVKGLFTLIIIVVVQMLEGNLLQPIVMSKTTKLHPVTIILGLLIFGYFFGILGMLISTPTLSCLKTIFKFFDEKYGILNYIK